MNIQSENIELIEKSEFNNSFLSSLLEIPDCPEKIYIRGKNISREDTKFIAIVGSRKHSSYAKNALEKIISEISGYNIVIISGLALGIDTLAHQFSLQNKMKTIAVPGSGISDSVIYPRSNSHLAKQILDSNGIIISEFDPEFKATPWSFPQRNRIMAGLADLVLVVEASEKSGTLITARLALEYNKDLSVIPASIFSDFSAGSNQLLKQGAHPVFSGTEILELLGINTESSKPLIQQKLDLSDFTKNEQIVLENLQEPKNKEQLQEESGLSVTELNTTLSILEIKGIIIQRLGKFRKV
jgi:DNA processing protein